MRRGLICSFTLLFFLYFSDVQAQVFPIDTTALIKSAQNFAAKNPQNILFIQTDKTIYTNNESIWFCAYLIKNESGRLGDHNILSVGLVREDEQAIELQANYIMQNGIGYGSLLLPDSIIPGNYQLQAFTNVLNSSNQPLIRYNQSIIIKSITQQDFKASISLSDSIAGQKEITARLQIIRNDPQSKERAQLSYVIGKSEPKKISIKNNHYDFSIPVKSLDAEENLLRTSVKIGDKIQHISLTLPGSKSQGIDVKFFPEGGNLVSDLPSRVAWEARTKTGLPIALTGTLLKNGLTIDTIATSISGIGKFTFQPEKEHNYSLKISANKYLLSDTIIDLPVAHQNGISLEVENAIVDDTLEMRIRSSNQLNFAIVVHNYRDIFGVIHSKANRSGTRIKMAIPGLPRGLAAVTILNEDGFPLAERLFFAHYDKKINALIKTEQTEYYRKDSINIKLKLSDYLGKPVQGLISAAVVQSNRIDPNRVTDIETYAHLTYHLGNLPRDPLGRGFDNKDFLENLLLVRGWSRFTWRDLTNSKSVKADTLHGLNISGQVRYNNKLLKKPISISVIRDSIFDIYETEIDGSFELAPERLVITEGRTMLISVNQKALGPYKVELSNPFSNIHDSLAQKIEVIRRGYARVTTSDEFNLKGLNQMQQLQEVVVTASTDNSIYGRLGANACGDYVCSYGILNCRNHPTGTEPVKGRIYQGRYYMGCILDEHQNIFRHQGIYFAREFYPLTKDDIIEPQFLSTLFWKPGIISDADGTAELSFFLGDITGEYSVFIQGISSENFIYGEHNFSVK